MSPIFKSSIVLFIIFFISAHFVQAQYATTKVKSVHQAYTDSLKQVEYDYIFPIWGQQAYKQGFDIPYPIGLMGNYLWMKQGIVLNDMQLGIKTDSLDIPLTDVDFIKFGDSYNTSWTTNIRPDVWVLPFLNVYGIFGYGRSKTEVNLVAPITLQSVVEQGIRTFGLGIMGAGGIGPIWFSVDANWTWNKPDLLDKPVNVNVLGLRLGHTFVFKEHPERNFAIWAGGMRIQMSSETVGQIALNEVISEETWERRDEIVADYYSWYDDLDPVDDAGKIIVADEVLTPIIERIDARDGSAIIRYGMNKQVKQRWNGTFGAQFQYNKHWMIRSEAGLIGDRKSFLLSLNYRFLL